MGKINTCILRNTTGIYLQSVCQGKNYIQGLQLKCIKTRLYNPHKKYHDGKTKQIIWTCFDK